MALSKFMAYQNIRVQFPVGVIILAKGNVERMEFPSLEGFLLLIRNALTIYDCASYTIWS